MFCCLDYDSVCHSLGQMTFSALGNCHTALFMYLVVLYLIKHSHVRQKGKGNPLGPPVHNQSADEVPPITLCLVLHDGKELWKLPPAWPLGVTVLWSHL